MKCLLVAWLASFALLPLAQIPDFVAKAQAWSSLDERLADLSEQSAQDLRRIVELNRRLAALRETCRKNLAQPQAAAVLAGVGQSLAIAQNALWLGIRLRAQAKPNLAATIQEPHRGPPWACGIPAELRWILPQILQWHAPEGGSLVFLHGAKALWSYRNAQVRAL